MEKINLHLWRRNAVATWVALIGLTLLAPSLARFGLHRSALALALLGIAVMKFVSISRWFMALKFAHAVWQTAIVVYVVLILGICCVALTG